MHNFNHFMVVGWLCGASPSEHYSYLGGSTRLPLHPPVRQTKMRADKLFSELRRAVPKPDKRTERHNSWISSETYILVYEILSTRWEPRWYQRRFRRLGQSIRTLLKEDRQRRVTTAGEEVESLLTGDPSLPREAWRMIQGWYQEAADHAPPHARVTLERITAEREVLYCTVPPPPPRGETIPLSVPPSPIDDSVPTEEEVKWAVRRLRGHCSGGPSRMRAEHLREWRWEHRVAEAATEVETEAVCETSGIEGR